LLVELSVELVVELFVESFTKVEFELLLLLLFDWLLFDWLFIEFELEFWWPLALFEATLPLLFAAFPAWVGLDPADSEPFWLGITGEAPTWEIFDNETGKKLELEFSYELFWFIEDWREHPPLLSTS
jgi:hypothetical protein